MSASPDQHVDVVVVGAGTCGGVIASRLSEDPSLRVLLLEAGTDYPEAHLTPWPWMTLGAGRGGVGSGPPVPEMDWGLWNEPLSHGRKVALTRGKVVGGSSMVNGCVAVRAKPSDFDEWTAAGADGWGWDELLPLFEQVENAIGIRRRPREQWLPIQDLQVRGFEELGFRWADDMNAPDSWDGVVGPWPQNLVNGIRGGTLVNYIAWARDRPNFELRDRVTVDKVIMDGTRATGIDYLDARGQRAVVRADRVVLAAGVFATSPLLMRSGIGSSAHLREMGIETVVDLPVGDRVMDHPACSFRMHTPPEIARIGAPPMAAVIRGTEWFAIPTPMDQESGLCSVTFCATTRGGDGTIRLASTDPTVAPRIDVEFEKAIIGGMFEPAWESFHQLLDTHALRAAGVRAAEPERTLEEILRERIGSGAHGVGGCAIGAVVNPHLEVYGTSSLFVADGSVFPRNVTNNPNLTCFVIGERAAQFVRASLVR